MTLLDIEAPLARTAVRSAATPVDAPRFVEDGGASARLDVWRLAWLFTWPTALVVAVFARFGGTVLESPDDGFILAQSKRILTGQVPHRDFISPRPVGSPLLHCIDFLVPLPLLSASRLVATIEVVAFTLAFAALVFRKPLVRWSLVQVSAASAAVFVNLHSFPLMVWHTIDGLLLVALGIVVLRNGLEANRRGRSTAGLVLLGAATVVKQSFAPAAVLGIAMVWIHRRERSSAPVSPGRASVLVALPALAYALVITLAGGLVPMIVQLAHAQPAFGTSLATVLWRSHGQGPVVAVGAVGLCLVDAYMGRTPTVRRIARVAARIGLSLLVVGVLLVTRTDPGDSWGRTIFVLLVIVVAWEWLAAREVDRVGIVMIAVGWMTSLSWGYPGPRLVAGSVALVVLDRLWRSMPRLPAGWSNAAWRVTAVIGVVTSLAVMETAIHERVLLNAAGTVDDGSIASVVPDLRGLRANLSTTELMRDVAVCRARFPARWTAVLPGPAVISTIMNLDDPFSVDWLYPPEIRGSEHRLVEEAHRLDARGHYLVLVVRPAAAGAMAPNPVLDRMVGELSGARSLCGNFVAIHSA